MEFSLRWFYHNDVFSCGFMQSDDKQYRSFVMADPPREHKIAKITRALVDGRYPLQIKKVDTPLTLKHRAAYGSWFKYHIEIMNVPNFQDIYVHSGIDATHTDGCLITQYGFNLSKQSNQGETSIESVKDFYALVYPRLEKGIPCFINVKSIEL